MALGLVHYVDEFHHLNDEILPRMQRLELRSVAPSD
jgi:hypothetical protein